MKKTLKLRSVRQKLGVSQVELARRMGVDQPTVSKWETGARYPFPHTLGAIAKALRCAEKELT